MKLLRISLRPLQHRLIVLRSLEKGINSIETVLISVVLQFLDEGHFDSVESAVLDGAPELTRQAYDTHLMGGVMCGRKDELCTRRRCGPGKERAGAVDP